MLERIVHIGVASVNRRVEDLKEVDERTSQLCHGELVEVVVEGGFGAEQSRIFGIEAEDQPDTEDIETLESNDAILVNILLEEFVVNDTHKIAGFDGHFHLSLEVCVALVHEEREARIFLLEVL